LKRSEKFGKKQKGVVRAETEMVVAVRQHQSVFFPDWEGPSF